MMRGSPFSDQSSRLASPAPVRVAEHLCRELEQRGIIADVNDGYGLAVVSIWHGLCVWTNGALLWWRVGWSRRHNRPVYAWHHASELQQAANRIAFCCAGLQAASRASVIRERQS